MSINKQKLIEDLKLIPEMDPDKHDGSYEVVRETVASYAAMEDLSEITYLDLNALYLMAVGTWKINIAKKKEKINQSHLPEGEKTRLCALLEKVWDNACTRKYENTELSDKPSFGMFGTGFYSFQDKTTDECARNFISMCVDMSKLSDANAIYERASSVLNRSFMGMKAASASVILHCLNPYVFPILNGNMGNDNIFTALGINLNKPEELYTYIENCRKIDKFRNEILPFKNYRILDRKAWELAKYEKFKYIPSLEEYDPGITTEQYLEILQDESLIKKSNLDTVYFIFKDGGEASCKQLEISYGNTAAHYNVNGTATAKVVQSATGCPVRRTDEKERYWPILFIGRDSIEGEAGGFVWKLRKPLSDAIAQLDEIGFFDGLIKNKEMTQFDSNTILYGPPGTGKTYNTVLYAVAIIEGEPLETVQVEAKADYKAVKDRYDAYKEAGRIAFTTFHQSYGYEEFIEGIKPVLSEGEDTNLSYTIEDGVFKEFCSKAQIKHESSDEDYGLNKTPSVWKVSLQGTGDNPVREECLKNNHIRIGYYQEDYDNQRTGGSVFNAFANKMRVGDIVFSCYSASTIDAIGVVTGEYEHDDSFDSYKAVRAVNWLVKDIREDIVDLNGGASMTLSSVYKMKISAADALALVSKLKDPRTLNYKSEPSNENYVFIIDEINRGNISKIFGELITLIETTKRLGKPEEVKVKLPYSKTEFGVPSNVYILGTMNTADRSIALMDTALRRRFSFVEMMPKPEVLMEMGIGTITIDVKELNVSRMLEIINKRIEFLFDREHTIGHAFFTGLKNNPSLAKLKEIFSKNIIPLLQEYFYEDYEKIQLVLGDNKKSDDDFKFITRKEESAGDLFNGSPELDAVYSYAVNEAAYENIESYIEIYEGAKA